MRARRNSIRGQLNSALWILSVVLALPAIVSLVMMLSYASQYQAGINRMETIADLKPMVATDIPEAAWMAVSGRMAFERCGVMELIDEANATLNELSQEGDQSGRLELTIAQRTMETLAQYVAQIERNLKADVPIVESERTLEEVRDVAALVGTMLENYIAEEINSAAETNVLLTRVVLATAAAEVALLIGALALSSYTRRRMSRFIHEPITRLEHFAGMVAEGNLKARVPPTDVIELEPLTQRINLMADRLESLIVQNRREQENLRKSELRTLQAQINPHFLYNTLDAIIWQAEAGHSDEVITITRALSDFFRISLSSGEDWIPLRQEIRHLAGYLSIQQFRYRDILTYEIDVPDELGDVYVLKLLLQPLVENALYHGIKDKRGGGRITVRGRREDDFLAFRVEDTGKGMTQEQLREVTARMRGEKPPAATPYAGNGSSFGLHNVDQRIRLYYNQSEGLRIASGAGGTVVSFRVPVRRKESAQE